MSLAGDVPIKFKSAAIEDTSVDKGSSQQAMAPY